MRYPAFTTNPNLNAIELNNVENEILETIEYPDLEEDENDVSKKAHSKVNNAIMSDMDDDVEMKYDDKSSIVSKHAKSNGNNAISSAKSKSFVTSHVISDSKRRQTILSRDNSAQFENPETVHQYKISNNVSHNEVSAKPIIDRSSKPAALKTYDPRCEKVVTFMKELNELAKSKVKLANELLNQEYELYSQREDKYSASDEKYLRGEIKSLKIKFDDMVFI